MMELTDTCTHFFFSEADLVMLLLTLVFEMCHLFNKRDGYISGNKLQKNPFCLWYLKLNTIHHACD